MVRAMKRVKRMTFVRIEQMRKIKDMMAIAVR